MNGRRFHGETCVLGDGAEIGFGAPLAVDDEEGIYDYRTVPPLRSTHLLHASLTGYIFRDVSEAGPAAIDDLYIPGEVLGGGAFGQVRLAFERGSNKVVAIKKINYVRTVKATLKHMHIHTFCRSKLARTSFPRCGRYFSV